MLATEIAIRAELASADMDAVIQRARDDAEARVLLSFVPTPAMFTSFISNRALIVEQKCKSAFAAFGGCPKMSGAARLLPSLEVESAGKMHFDMQRSARKGRRQRALKPGHDQTEPLIRLQSGRDKGRGCVRLTSNSTAPFYWA